MTLTDFEGYLNRRLPMGTRTVEVELASHIMRELIAIRELLENQVKKEKHYQVDDYTSPMDFTGIKSQLCEQSNKEPLHNKFCLDINKKKRGRPKKV